MFRLFIAVLLLSCGCCFGDNSPSKNIWIDTGNPPSGILSIGWHTELLSNGLVLGVGNRDVGRHSVAYLYSVKTNEWSVTGDIPDGIAGLASSVTQLPNGM